MKDFKFIDTQKVDVVYASNNKLAIYLLLILFFPFHLQAKVIYSWSQVAPNDILSIRTIIDNESCPIAYVDGEQIPMNERAPPHGENFPEKICELSLSKDVKEVKIDDYLIPVISSEIKKIAFIGDTGCRITDLIQQSCNSDKDWPFAKVLNSISTHKPDLVVHVGDYHYREKSCKDKKKCGQIHGYNSKAWHSDWFDPAKNLSTLSPFLFVRGNHENCTRAHQGWFRYLDANNFSEAECQNYTPSWTFDAGPMQLSVFDSSYGKDSDYTEEQIKNFRGQFNSLLQNNPSKPTWFLTHRPLWSYAKKSMIFYQNGNIAQVKAFGNNFPTNISAIISGHVHIAQIIFMKKKPTQIMVGNGGALLYSQDQKPVVYGVELDGARAQEVKTFLGFGFTMLDLEEHKISFYDENNNEVYSSYLADDFSFCK